jgi:hypothetical protein
MQMIVHAVLSLMLAASGAADYPGRDGEGSTIINHSRNDDGISVRHNNEPIVEGSGNIVRQARSAAAFSSVHVQGPFDLEILVGPRHSVEVEIDGNLSDRIGTRVEGGELRIETTGSFRTRSVPKVRLTVPTLDRVLVQGSGDARIRGVKGGRLELVGQGSGDFVVDGRADSLVASLFGSGNADLTRIEAPDLTVSVYGSGDARVRATRALSASVFGSGRIDYSGDPTEVSRSVHGSGRIGRISN